MTTSISVLHIADLHFGMENYGFTNPRTGLHTRLEDFSNSLGQAVDAAVEKDVDLVVFAGDAYKRNSPSPTEQRELSKHILRLADHQIPVVMIAGNHDIPVIQGKATSIDIFQSMREGMIHVVSGEPTWKEKKPLVIETKNGPIGVCCLPFISPSALRLWVDDLPTQHEELTHTYVDLIQEVIETMPALLPDDLPKMLVAHLSVQGAMLGGYRGSPLFMDEIPVLPATLAKPGYDYAALGHIHQHQNLSKNPNVPVVYSGSIDRVDFGEADEAKGFVLASVSRGGSTYEFQPIQVREFIHIRAEPKKGDDITECILGEIELERDRMEGAVVRVTYTANDDEAASVDLKRINEALRAAHFKAGFFRIPRESAVGRRNTSLSAEVQLADALTAYLDEHEETRSHREAILKKALEMEKEVKQMLEPRTPA